MKAERRHELQTNSLALWLQIRLPEIWQKYGNHILLGLIIVVGAYWFARWRVEAPKKARAQATQVLGIVNQNITGLRRMSVNPEDVADVPQRISDALNTSDDKDIQALAHALLGEYHWTLASMPQGLTTQPARISPDELYRKADENFRNALAAGSRQPDILARAHFGRAMIAEQQAFEKARGQQFKADPAKEPLWQVARAAYQAVADNPDMYPVLREEAKLKISELEKMQKPVWIGKVNPTTVPVTMPSGPLGPEAPTTRVVGATTRPVK